MGERPEPPLVKSTVLRAAQTHALRGELRSEPSHEPFEFPADENQHSLHLGLMQASKLLAILSATPEQIDEIADNSVRLYGLVVHRDHRRKGLGQRMLFEMIEHPRWLSISGGPITVFWANVRADALSFYDRLGFEILDREFRNPLTGLLSRRVVWRIPPGSGID